MTDLKEDTTMTDMITMGKEETDGAEVEVEGEVEEEETMITKEGKVK